MMQACEGKISNRKINILLIEDDPDDALLVKEELNEATNNKENNIEFNLSHIIRLAEGLELASKETFDAIVLDLSLPDCIGLDTFKKVHSKYPLIPIIVLTGTQLSREPLRDCIQGASGYLLKGYTNTESLVQTILSSIERQETINELSKHFLDSNQN